MDAEINYLLQDSKVLDGTITTNKAVMMENGFLEEDYTEFTTAREDLRTKETAQEKAVKKVSDFTTVQNNIIEEHRDLISQVKTAAKAIFGNDARALKPYEIGKDIPKSVSRLSSECDIMSELVKERSADFSRRGFIQTKQTKLANGSSAIEAADKQQENAKKLQKSATLERDAAAKVLKDKVFRIRNFAKTCFSGKPEILVQFDPIPKGKGGAGEQVEEPAATEQPAATK